jgi:hypothetical protein
VQRVLRLAVVAALVLAVTACGATKTVTNTVTVGAKTGVGPPGELAQFGYIRSLVKHGRFYDLRFDPALMLSGITANKAAAEDGAVEPGQPVPNDNYTVNEGRRTFLYRVPPSARVTVLANSPTGKKITVAQLAALVAGRNPLGRRLFEPISTGFWMVTNIDTVRALDQQYRP